MSKEVKAAVIAAAATIIAAIIGGWFLLHSSPPQSSPPSEPISVPNNNSSGSTFPNVAGTHRGIIYIPNVLENNNTYTSSDLTLTFQQDGGSISGNCYVGSFKESFTGTIDTGGHVKFTCGHPENAAYKFTGVVGTDGSLQGDFDEYVSGNDLGSSTWSTN